MTFTEINGFQWPAADKYCGAAVFAEGSVSLERVYPRVTQWGSVVQAGGNCGVWPWLLSSKFGAVYTFEPDADNFTCLARNTPMPNVYKFRAALGDGREARTALFGDPENCGAYMVRGTGTIPVLTIDALRLNDCGLIYLDVEGFEGPALLGAQQTILTCRPIIAVEAKGLEERYGWSPTMVPELLVDGFKYAEVDRFGRDVVYAYAGG